MTCFLKHQPAKKVFATPPENSKHLIVRVILIVAILLASNASAHQGSRSVEESLRSLDALYAKIIPWIIGLYDEKTGGFFQAESLKSGAEDQPYVPDIQSTFQAILFLESSGALSILSESQKQNIISYFQTRQDPNTGYFSDPFYPQMKENSRVMGRALMFSLHGLRILKAKPSYPLPGERRHSAPVNPEEPSSKASLKNTSSSGSPSPRNSSYLKTEENDTQTTIPNFLTNADSFQLWLDSLPWDNSWKAIDALSSHTSLIQRLKPTLRDELADIALNNVRLRQDSVTGLIGEGSLNVRISGAFKLIAFCKKLKRPTPYAKELRGSVLRWFQAGAETDQILFIFNATEMLSSLVQETGEPLSDEEVIAVIDISSKELEKYRSSDGVFRRRLSGYRISPNDLFWHTSNLPDQGEMNAVHASRGVRESLYRLAGIPMPPLHASTDDVREQSVED